MTSLIRAEHGKSVWGEQVLWGSVTHLCRYGDSIEEECAQSVDTLVDRECK